jgi:membrane fusion protein (multidrug efflux system)
MKEARREPNLGLILADGSNFKYKGEVTFINREVDPETGSLLIQASFPNPDNLLKPGQYAKVVVKMEVIEDALLIPQRCVMELQGQFSVYVVDSENIVKAIQINAGETIGDMLVVNEGLKAGDKVVIDALQKVGSGMKVNPKPTVFESQSSNIQE